jgi:hypothetical protein
VVSEVKIKGNEITKSKSILSSFLRLSIQGQKVFEKKQNSLFLLFFLKPVQVENSFSIKPE